MPIKIAIESCEYGGRLMIGVRARQKSLICAKLFIFLSLLLFAQGAARTAAADYSLAKRHFNALSIEEQVGIGLGLISTGDFAGLLEFGFTQRFYRAIQAYQSREGFAATGILLPDQSRRLKGKWEQFKHEMGFESIEHPDSGSVVFVPKRLFDTAQRTPRGFAFERGDESMSLSFVAYPTSQKTFAQLYETLALPTAQRNVTYKALKSSYFVSTGTFRGKKYYTWMNLVHGGTSGFTISWGNGKEDLGSKVAMVLANTFLAEPTGATSAALPALPPGNQTDNSDQQPNREDTPATGSGTGFKVTSNNHVLTNNHVAGNCKELTVTRSGDIPIKAELVASDPVNDLALLKTRSSLAGATAKFNGGAQPRAGEEIVVYGFPLAGALASSGNIVVGNIAALAGLGNDSRHYQISAPVQPGNSGGPLLNNRGQVVGIVVAKLNAIETAKVTGDIPQNINFAIKGNVVTNFLESNEVSFEQDAGQTKLEVPALAEMAKTFTVLVQCRN